jgi:head-tail adaptor
MGRMVMRASEMTERIRIETPTETIDSDFGGAVQTWGVSATCFAKIDRVAPAFANRAESVTGEPEQDLARSEIKFTIRERSDKTFTVKDRILFRGEYAEIKSVTLTPDRAWREILTEVIHPTL